LIRAGRKAVKRTAIASGLACLAALMLIQAAPAGPAPKATRVVAPKYAHPGGEFLAQATVKGRSAAAKLDFYLSKNRKWSKDDIHLGGQARVPALRAGKSYAAAGLATVPIKVAPGSYYLLVCARGHKCGASSSKIALAPFEHAVTTQSLLDEAVSKGQISAEKALVYRAYAAYGDRRLPKRYAGDYYAGDKGGMGDDSAMQDLAAAWPTLSASAKKSVSPFFVPPAAKGSWMNLPTHPSAAARAGSGGDDPADPCDSSQLIRSDWKSLPAAGGKVRIWWYDDPATPWNQQSAIFLSRQIGPVYKRFKALMGREPLSDAKSPCFHGPDGALDIYLVRWVEKAIALTVPAAQNTLTPFDCTNTPAFIVDRTLGGRPTIYEIAHELFHAFQMAFPYKGGDCKEYQWFDEGSASWAVHYGLHPNDPGSGGRSPLMMEALYDIATPLDDMSYESWYLDLYIEEMLGAAKIPAIYNAFATQKSLPAINSVLDFKKRWPEFTLKGWNQDPVTPSFRQWEIAGGWGDVHPMEDWVHGVEMKPTELAIGGLAERTLNLPADVKYLARKYMKVAVRDDNIRYLRFNNTLAGIGAAGVQAIVTFADGHQDIQDWSGRSKVEFCFDDSSGTGDDVTDIVLMYSNSDWQGKQALNPSDQPTLTIRKQCETYQYKILNASLATTATGSWGSDLCTLGGITTTASRNLTSAMMTQPTPLVSKLEPTMVNGTRYVSGKIEASVKVTFQDHYDSCQIVVPDGIVPCSFGGPQMTYDGNVDFYVDYQPWTDSTVTFHGSWFVPDPEIGIASGSYETPCSTPYMHFTFPPSDSVKDVPVYKFTAGGEQGISFSGSKHFTNSYGDSLEYSWTLSLSYLRVDENGNPL